MFGPNYCEHYLLRIVATCKFICMQKKTHVNHNHTTFVFGFENAQLIDVINSPSIVESTILY